MLQKRSFRLATILGRKYFSSSSGIKHLGVVGCGQMGTGIAIVGAKNPPYNVTMIDQTQESLEKSKNFISNWLDLEIKKERITSEQKAQIQKRFNYTTKFEDFHDCDFVVQAVNQNLELKMEIFKRLDKFVKPQGILATNTSSISLTKLAACVQRPDRVIGTHFMNPVPKMKIVQVIKGIQTSDKTQQIAKNFIKQLKKQMVSSKDTPGFIINRIFIPYLNEAIFALYEGIATKEDIDKGVKYGLNVPMGPLQLSDFIGLDTQPKLFRVLAVQNVLYDQLKDSKYRPCTLLVNMVNAGYLGKKSGKGFYDYPQQKK